MEALYGVVPYAVQGFQGRRYVIDVMDIHNINSRLKGAVDRELGGKYIKEIRIFDVLLFCGKANFILRFLRIRPVQKVKDNPTQLSGRGFPRIFHMKLVLSQLGMYDESKALAASPQGRPQQLIGLSR